MVEPVVVIEISSRINLFFEHIEHLANGVNFTLFQAKSREDGEVHTIRVFNPDCNAAKLNYDLAATIYMQEVIHLCMKLPDHETVLLEFFEFSKGKIIFVTKCHYPVKKEVGQKSNVDLEKMIKDVISDVKLLYTKLNLGELVIDSKTIHTLKGSNFFFITDWANSRRVELEDFRKKETLKLAPEIQALSIANKEVHFLGLLVFELAGVTKNQLEALFKPQNEQDYNQMLQEMVSGINSLTVQNIVKRIFNKSLDDRMTMINLLSEFSGLVQKKIAWCSLGLNSISIYNMQLNKMTTDLIKGAVLKNQGGTTFLEQIPNSELLISVIHNPEKSATFEVFNSAKGKQLLFSFGEKKGTVGTGDVCINPRTLLTPLISVKKSVGYHLFDCRSLSVTRKGKWQPLHKAPTDSYMLSPDSTRLASIDWNSLMLVSNINDDSLLFQTTLGKKSEWFNRCRWNPLIENPLIAVKFDRNKFNLYDVNSCSNIHTNHISLDHKGDTMWIEWRSCGNLIASCGSDLDVKIYDIREGKIVKKFEKMHEGPLALIYMVKFNGAGNLMGTAARDSDKDKSIKVVEFSTEKPLYYFKTFDEYYAHSLCFIEKAALL